MPIPISLIFKDCEGKGTRFVLGACDQVVKILSFLAHVGSVCLSLHHIHYTEFIERLILLDFGNWKANEILLKF